MPTAVWGNSNLLEGCLLHHTKYLIYRTQQIYIGCRKISLSLKARPWPTQTIFDQRMPGVEWRKQLLEATNNHLNRAKWMSRKTTLLSAGIGCSVPRRIPCGRKKMRVKRNSLQSCYSSLCLSLMTVATHPLQHLLYYFGLNPCDHCQTSMAALTPEGSHTTGYTDQQPRLFVGGNPADKKQQ